MILRKRKSDSIAVIRLIDARKLFQRGKKWIQYSYGDDCRGYCAYGAYDHAFNLKNGSSFSMVNWPEPERAAYTEAYDLLNLATPRGSGGIVNFNDKADTTYELIDALFCRAVGIGRGELWAW